MFFPISLLLTKKVLNTLLWSECPFLEGRGFSSNWWRISQHTVHWRAGREFLKNAVCQRITEQYPSPTAAAVYSGLMCLPSLLFETRSQAANSGPSPPPHLFLAACREEAYTHYFICDTSTALSFPPPSCYLGSL